MPSSRNQRREISTERWDAIFAATRDIAAAPQLQATPNQRNVQPPAASGLATKTSVPTIHPAWAKSNEKLQALRGVNHATSV